MNSGIDDQAHRTEEFRGEAAIIRDGVLVEANLFAELFRVQSPAFSVSVEAKTVEAEFGQPSELLLNRELHVMAGNAFMIGNGFVIDERAVSKVGCSHYHAAGALAVRSARDIVSCRSSLERGYGFYGDRRLGQQVEKAWELGLHLGDVTAEIVKDLLRGGWNVFGIGFERSPESDQVGEAFFFGDHHHFGLDAFHLAQAELVYFIGRHVRGGATVDVILVTLLAIRQRGDCERGAALGRVFLADECGKALVGRNYVSVDGVSNLLRQALLVFCGDARGIFLGREQKWIGVNNALALHRDFLKQEPDRHQFVLHSGAKDFSGLAEDARNLMQTRDVVLIVLD